MSLNEVPIWTYHSVTSCLGSNSPPKDKAALSARQRAGIGYLQPSIAPFFPLSITPLSFEKESLFLHDLSLIHI